MYRKVTINNKATYLQIMCSSRSLVNTRFVRLFVCLLLNGTSAQHMQIDSYCNGQLTTAAIIKRLLGTHILWTPPGLIPTAAARMKSNVFQRLYDSFDRRNDRPTAGTSDPLADTAGWTSD